MTGTVILNPSAPAAATALLMSSTVVCDRLLPFEILMEPSAVCVALQVLEQSQLPGQGADSVRANMQVTDGVVGFWLESTVNPTVSVVACPKVSVWLQRNVPSL